MNIFASSPDPEQCASFLDDKRLVKMVLETAQLLSTAINVCGSGIGPYKTTHVNHPCSIWTRESVRNYTWLVWHFEALCEEYTKRYKKVHKCQQHLRAFVNGANLMPIKDSTPFPNCTIFKQCADTHQAYRDYLEYKWKNDKRTPKWSGYTKEQIKCLGL
jgi:hypothetical protein